MELLFFYGVASKSLVCSAWETYEYSVLSPPGRDGTVPVNFRSMYLHVTLRFWQDRVTKTVWNKSSHHILGRRQSSFSQGYQYSSWWTDSTGMPTSKTRRKTKCETYSTGTLTTAAKDLRSTIQRYTKNRTKTCKSKRAFIKTKKMKMMMMRKIENAPFYNGLYEALGD